MNLRLAALIFCFLFFITGCVNYVGIHAQAKPITATQLATQKTYKIAEKSSSYNWWMTLRDKQLNHLISVAVADSPTMKIAQSRLLRAQAIAEASVAPLWPTIDASGYVQRQRFSQRGLAPPPFNGRTFNILDLGLNFNYEIDFWGKNREALAARVSEACAAQADVAQARLVLSAAVANAYFQVQSNQQQVMLARRIANQQQQLMEIIRDRTLHGITSDIPLKTSIADAEAARLAVDQYAEAEQIARHQLAVLLGDNPFTTDIKTTKLAYQHYKLPAFLPANLLANRPDIMVARLQMEAAAHEVNVAKARFFPNVNLTALFSYQRVGYGNLFAPGNQNNAVTGAIDLPIFDAGARRANLRLNYADYDAAVNTYNQAILTALQEVADQATTLRSLTRQINTQGDVIGATQHNYKLINSRYNHGVVDYVQVLEIKNLLLQQQATQINLQARYLLSMVAMIKALGGTDLTGQG